MSDQLYGQVSSSAISLENLLYRSRQERKAGQNREAEQHLLLMAERQTIDCLVEFTPMVAVQFPVLRHRSERFRRETRAGEELGDQAWRRLGGRQKRIGAAPRQRRSSTWSAPRIAACRCRPSRWTTMRWLSRRCWLPKWCERGSPRSARVRGRAPPIDPPRALQGHRAATHRGRVPLPHAARDSLPPPPQPDQPRLGDGLHRWLPPSRARSCG